MAIEPRGGEGDEIHLHAGGQGVWVARMAGELGADPVLCGFAGGETGALLIGLLAALPGERRLVATAGASGCYVTDRREGERKLVSRALSPPPSRHELDDLFSTTVAAALESDVLVVCNPFPADALPLELYRDLVADVRAAGKPVLVDLSTPRLDSALAGGPELVKLNDWELAEYVCGPVDSSRAAGRRRAPARAGARWWSLAAGTRRSCCTRGRGLELAPPRFTDGSREGCGDSMMGALAAALGGGHGLREDLQLGAAAGAANFLRHGLGRARAPWWRS